MKDSAKNNPIDRIARVFAKARGCFEPGSAASEAGFPCPFCQWDEAAQEESGCYYWATKAIEAFEAAPTTREEYLEAAGQMIWFAQDGKMKGGLINAAQTIDVDDMRKAMDAVNISDFITPFRR